MATKKKAAGASEEDQETKTTKPKTARASGTKRVVRKKAKQEEEEKVGDLADQPIVYSGKSEEESSVVKETAPKSTGGSMDAAKVATPLSAASLHKQPMQAPTPSSFSIPASNPTPPAVSSQSTFSPKMSPADDGEILRDIKRREGAAKDASFLAPEKFSFDLKKSSAATGKSKWINILIYSLSTLIIVLTILLFILTFYSGEILNSDSDQVADQEQNIDNEGGEQVAGAYQLTTTNLPADLQAALNDLVKTEFSDNSISLNSDSSGVQLPEVTRDTLFVKEANLTETNSLMTMLAEYGITPEIRQLDSLPVSAALYFVTTLQSPDLSGLTATVYNANGTAGLAKQYCDALTAMKVSNCQALNATGNQTGNAIEYKNPKALFILKRTGRFSSARFTQAPSGQIEDIKVTIGR